MPWDAKVGLRFLRIFIGVSSTNSSSFFFRFELLLLFIRFERFLVFGAFGVRSISTPSKKFEDSFFALRLRTLSKILRSSSESSSSRLISIDFLLLEEREELFEDFGIETTERSSDSEDSICREASKASSPFDGRSFDPVPFNFSSAYIIH